MRTDQREFRAEWKEPPVAQISLRTTNEFPSEPPVVWGLLGGERERVVEALDHRDDPLGVSERPWAAVVIRTDGSVVATSSPTLPGGLIWTVDTDRNGERQLIIGHHVGWVVQARTSPTELDGEWLRARLSGFLVSESTTPFQGVHHLRFGITAVWRPGCEEPDLTEWFGPDTMPEPSLSGPSVESTYLTAFDAVIDELVEPGQPITATLSGGLDSSFVVASLVRHASPDNPVHCYTHSPHPAAGLSPVGNWDPDDFEYALAMQRAYPGRVVVHRVINEALADPLDFIIESSLAGWMPNFNINGMWMQAMSTDAAKRGAAVLFHGTNGNAAFSHDHPYAAGYYLRRGHLRSTAELLKPAIGSGRSFVGNAKSLLAAELAPHRRRRGEGQLMSYLAAVGLAHLIDEAPSSFSSTVATDRSGYLSWLTRTAHRVPEHSPLAWPVTPVDPFAARGIGELAASVEPKQWRQGPLNRSFARTTGFGRVPDSVRLRTRKGMQSADLWFVTRQHCQRYLDEIALLPATPFIGGWVDHLALRRNVELWQRDQHQEPPGWTVRGLHHVLGLAAYIRGISAVSAANTPGVQGLTPVESV